MKPLTVYENFGQIKMIARNYQIHKAEDNQHTHLEISSLDNDQKKGEKTLSVTTAPCASPKLIPLVLRPILTFLQVMGMPVPPLCRHINDEQTTTHNGFSDIESLPQEYQLPWELRHRQTDCLNGLQNPGLSTCLPDDKCFERSMQDLNKIEILYPRSEGDDLGSPCKYDEAGCVLRNKQARKKMKPVQPTVRHFVCPSCRRKAIASKIVFVILVCLMAANILRYITFFIGRTEINEEVVSGVVFLSFFVCCTYIYVHGYFCFSKYLPKFLNLVYRYEKHFSTCLDLHAVKKRVRLGIIISIVIQSLCFFTFTICPFTFLPSFRRHLSPFDTWEGWPIYVMWTIISTTILMKASVLCCMAQFLRANAYIVRMEFSHINSQLKKIFTLCEVSILPGKHIRAGEKDTKLDRQGSSLQCRVWDSKMQNGKVDTKRTWSERDGKKKNFFLGLQKSLKKSVSKKQTRRSRHLQSKFNPPNAQKRNSEEPSSPCDVRQTFAVRFARMEILFDRLRVQHEFVVRILEHSQFCLSHVIGMAFIFSIPIICIIIFGLSGDSMQTDEAAFMFWIIGLTLVGMSFVMMMSIYVNVKVGVESNF